METNKDIGESVEYYKAQLELCQKKLLRVERQLEKSESYNEDLRSQLEKVSAELHQYRTASKQRVDAAVQTEEIIADSDGITVQQNTEADVSQGESKDTVLREKVQETSTGEEIYSNNSSDNQLPNEEGQSASNNVTGEEVTTPSTSLAEELKSAAEEAISQSGYVYDERSGLYYDYNSGYYYDAEKSLFYDPNSGTYFYFNNETQEYTFHSQVDVSQYTTPYYGYYKNTSYRDHDQPSSNWSTQSSSYSQGQGHYSSQYYSDRRDRRRDVRTSSRRKTVENKEKEDIDKVTTALKRLNFTTPEKSAIEIGSGSWPPCIRVIVTDSDCLDPGSLYIITCDGAQIGREKDQGNTIIIPDLNVSKVHASISYQSDLQQYVITDHGSQNGTFLDETRISESKIESRAEKLSHGSTLQFSCTRFLLHIHNGAETCDDCEPGQVQATMSKPAQKEAYTFLSKEERIKQQRQNLKQIKKKYGLQNAPYVDNVAAIKNPTYQDKAEERRRTKGSDNPYIPDEAPASVNKPIAETNVGHKLLKKMGWSEGESLGKDNEGIQQPIMASIRANQKAGLGSSLGGEQSLDNANITSKYQRKLQAQARFQKVSKESDNNQADSGSSTNWVQGETQTS